MRLNLQKISEFYNIHSVVVIQMIIFQFLRDIKIKTSKKTVQNSKTSWADTRVIWQTQTPNVI